MDLSPSTPPETDPLQIRQNLYAKTAQVMNLQTPLHITLHEFSEVTCKSQKRQVCKSPPILSNTLISYHLGKGKPLET